jgi:hypothetical protein
MNLLPPDEVASVAARGAQSIRLLSRNQGLYNSESWPESLGPSIEGEMRGGDDEGQVQNVGSTEDCQSLAPA